jgi:hypothetical protein
VTKGKERSIFYGVKKAFVLLSGILALAASQAIVKPSPVRPLWASSGEQAAPQEIQKPKYDYMSTFLSRSTQPLGLKEDPAVKKLLSQGAVRWAIRAGSRHVLD